MPCSFRRVSGHRRRSLSIPWQSLKYDTQLEGYLTDLREDHRGALKSREEGAWDWNDPKVGRLSSNRLGSSSNCMSPPDQQAADSEPDHIAFRTMMHALSQSSPRSSMASRILV